MSLRDYEVGYKIGQGSYGSVYLVTRIADRQTFVLKQMQISNISDKEREAFETEVGRSLPCPRKWIRWRLRLSPLPSCNECCNIVPCIDPLRCGGHIHTLDFKS